MFDEKFEIDSSKKLVDSSKKLVDISKKTNIIIPSKFVVSETQSEGAVSCFLNKCGIIVEKLVSVF